MPVVDIDGCKVEVPLEATVLDAARLAGIWIPTLCYHPAVSCEASCRICMVELDRGDWKQLVTACNYPVRRDLSVSVSSPAAVRARRGVMQLLLARVPRSRQLLDLAARMGVDGTPYPTVTESQRHCILCGLCVRVCEEAIGQAAIGFVGRGVGRIVGPPFLKANPDCIVCGACAAVCPVGTIQIREHEDTGEHEVSPFKARAKLQLCAGCGARMVAEPVAREALARADFDWDEFRRRCRLCPRCRRKETAAGAALLAEKGQT